MIVVCFECIRGSPSTGLGIAERSQMSAWESSPAVQMWQDECGAQAMALTACEWPMRSATGMEGMLRSAVQHSAEKQARTHA